jgi:hypothetical protein
MNASGFSEREVSRVKPKVRWLTLGLITHKSIIFCRKGDHTRENSPDPTVLILNSVNTCWTSVLLDLPISNKFNFQFSVVLLLVTTKFISKEFIQFKSGIISAHILEHCWLGDFVRVKNAAIWQEKPKKKRNNLESKCVCRRIMIKWISFQMNENVNVINLPFTRVRMNRGNKYAGQKMPGISRLVVYQLPSLEGLY